MSKGIRFYGVAAALTPAELAHHGLDKIPEGAWLAAADIDADRPADIARWTTDPAQAMRFDPGGDALTFWRQVSKRNPVRPDGRPNRPLTAFTVSVEEIPEETTSARQ